MVPPTSRLKMRIDSVSWAHLTKLDEIKLKNTYPNDSVETETGTHPDFYMAKYCQVGKIIRNY